MLQLNVLFIFFGLCIFLPSVALSVVYNQITSNGAEVCARATSFLKGAAAAAAAAAAM